MKKKKSIILSKNIQNKLKEFKKKLNSNKDY